ncbi:MAG: hypothetical protein ACI9ZH_001856 [Paracoccaceae bacterium]|jgi:hypothetical protein
MTLMKPLLTGLAASLLATSAFTADITIRVAHLNPEDPFKSHSGAMT